MTTDVSWYNITATTLQQKNADMMPQRLVKDSWLKIRARLLKARTRRVGLQFNDSGVPHTDAYVKPPEHELGASKCCRSKDGVQYLVVTALLDIPTFVGLDTHNYDLKKDDIVLVPCANARVLCERGLAVVGARPLKRPSRHPNYLREEGDILILSGAY